MGNEYKTKERNDNKLDIVKESFENGLTYEGELKDGEWCGQGILISHPDGFRYKGQFKNDPLSLFLSYHNCIQSK